MDSGLYAAYTGLAARTQALDTAANNLANAGTNGFRAQRDYFRGVLVEGLSPDSLAQSQVGEIVNNELVFIDSSGGGVASYGQPIRMTLRRCFKTLNFGGFRGRRSPSERSAP